MADDDEAPTLSPAAIKALEKLPSLMKLTEKQGYGIKQDASGTADDESGRSRLADFLYGEYSLEEVIYTLAKTMFTQSLTHGSEESQAALQKLTQFLENEGKHGRISPALQKKILSKNRLSMNTLWRVINIFLFTDVLLASLSDTLNENPEVMEKARLVMSQK